MKTIIILIVLLTILVSMSVGQAEIYIEQYLIPPIDKDTMSDPLYVTYYCYKRMKHRVDSLAMVNEDLRNQLDITIRYWNNYRESTYVALNWRDSMNGELRAKYNALRDSVEQSLNWQGYWRIDTTVYLLRRFPYYPIKIDTTGISIDTTWRPLPEADNETQR